MARDIDICNMALAFLGTRTITSLTEVSGVNHAQEAEICRHLYHPLRQRLLTEHNWSFSTTYASLALNDEDPTTGWVFSYTYPKDALFVHRLYYEHTKDVEYIRFYVGYSPITRSKAIYTDLNSAHAEYTLDVIDSNRFDPLFVAAFARLLAAELAIALAKPRTVVMAMRELYFQEISRAKALDSKEQYEGPRTINPYVDARR